MYCNNCGKKVGDGIFSCPYCDAQLPSAPAVKQDVNKSGSHRAKGYAAVVSALLAFPALICLVTDYLGAPEFVLKAIRFFGFTGEKFQQGNISWSLFLIGFLMCVWMIAVLPAFKPKHPTVTVLACFTAVTLYMLLLAFVVDGAEWYKHWVLPVFLMVTLSSVIMSVLISNKIIKGKHIPVAIGVQLALLSVGFEVVGDMNIYGEVNLRLSLIAAVTVIGLVIIYEAINYAVKLNKK